MELLQSALAFNQVIAARLTGEQEASQPRNGGRPGLGPTSGGAPCALVSALVPLKRDSELALQSPRRASLQLSLPGSLDEPLLPSADQPGRAALRRPSTCGLEPSHPTRWSRTWSGGSDKKAEPPAQRPLFPTADSVKARVLEALQTPEYRVEDLYKERGLFQAVASSRWFQGLTLVVIALNAVWIAVETDYNKAAVLCDAPRIFQIVDNAFCLYFTLEICTRLFAFRRKLDAFRDVWFVFDGTLVLLMIWETWVIVALYRYTGGGGLGLSAGNSSALRILRIFRLSRVARTARLLRGMPQLMILVKGMVEGIRSVFATLLLLVLIIYVFAIMFTQLLSGTEVGAGCFDTVPEAMNCLLLEGVFTEQAEFVRKLLATDWKYYVFMLVYLLFVSLTVMNMLIAVLCEVVSVVAQVDKEEHAMKELRFKVTDLMRSLGIGEGAQVVSKEHFNKLMDTPEAMRSLHSVGVDVVALVQLSDFLFRDGEELSLSDFMETVLQFRGTNTATVKDVVDMRKFVSRELASLEVRLLRSKA